MLLSSRTSRLARELTTIVFLRNTQLVPNIRSVRVLWNVLPVFLGVSTCPVQAGGRAGFVKARI